MLILLNNVLYQLPRPYDVYNQKKPVLSTGL